MGLSAVKLFSQNSNLYDHDDTSTSHPDGRTTCLGNTALRVASRGKKTESVAYVNVPKLLSIVCRLGLGKNGLAYVTGCTGIGSQLAVMLNYYAWSGTYSPLLPDGNSGRVGRVCCATKGPHTHATGLRLSAQRPSVYC